MFESRSPIVLGSGSPRRKQMLEEAGLQLAVVVPDVDESQGNALPSEYLKQVVAKKLVRTRELIGERSRDYSAIICADTIVCLEGAVLQKPGDEKECEDMLSRLSGQQHSVMSAYVIFDPSTEYTRCRTITTGVRFRRMSPLEIRAYVLTGEGMDKAGGYAVQGRGAVFVESVEGSYSNVVGLPLCELFRDLAEMQLISTSSIRTQRGS